MSQIPFDCSQQLTSYSSSLVGAPIIGNENELQWSISALCLLYPPNHFLIVRGSLGASDASLSFCPDRPTSALNGANLSGLYGGQSSGTMLLLAIKSWQTLAACRRALSCCKISWCCCMRGVATGRRGSRLYLTAFILPSITINYDLPCAQCLPRPKRNHPQTYPFRQRRRRRSVPRDVDHPGKKSKARLVSRKDSSPLPHWKLPRRMAQYHKAQPTVLRQGRTYVRAAGMKTTLTQSILHSFWRNASIMSAYGINGSFDGRWRLHKCAKRIARCWRRDVTRRRPAHGRSTRRPVSRKRMTRRSIAETLTSKWLAPCCS